MPDLQEGLLDEITQRLVEELHPDEIVLFGSHAWGIPDAGSDLDLLLVLPDGRDASASAELRARRCLRGIMIPKDILVRSRTDIERLQRVPASLEHQILKQGRVLYGGSQARTGPGLVDQSTA